MAQEHVSKQQCLVELFGPARLAAGEKAVALEMAADATLRDVVPLLAERCPALVGRVLDLERRALVEGYIFNLNGRDFAPSLDLPVRDGDHVLLLSSSAGG